MRVSVVATGIAAENSNTKPKPQMTLVSSQKDPIAARLEVDQTESEEPGVEQQKLVQNHETENSQELMSLQRTGTFDESVEFDITATTGKPLEAASITNELKIDK